MVSPSPLLKMSHISFQSSVSCSLLGHFFSEIYFKFSPSSSLWCSCHRVLQMHLLRDHSKVLAASHVGMNPWNLQTAEKHMKRFGSERPGQPHLAESIFLLFIIDKDSAGQQRNKGKVNICLFLFLFSDPERKQCRRQLPCWAGWVQLLHCSAWEVTGMRSRQWHVCPQESAGRWGWFSALWPLSGSSGQRWVSVNEHNQRWVGTVHTHLGQVQSAGQGAQHTLTQPC